MKDALTLFVILVVLTLTWTIIVILYFAFLQAVFGGLF